MIIVDSSALCAILFDEPERARYNAALDAARTSLVCAATFVEASIVIQARKGDSGVRELDHHLARAKIEPVSVDAAQARAAREAFRLYGKGRHAAGLNFGDCFTYALAKVTGYPVLAKGPEFALTDIEVVAI